MSGVVFDASLAAAALCPSQFLPAAARLLYDPSKELVAPSILRQEFTNAVWRLQRRGSLTAEQADNSLREFGYIPMEIVDAEGWIPRALAITRRFDQPRIFDAIYLACAEDLGVDLWTCDRRFVQSFGRERSPLLKLCPDDLP